MRLTIDIPDPQQAISRACPVPIAIKGVTWKEACLGEHAKESGVYVIHHGEAIRYVGKTGSPGMSFGMRLRREFQQTASGPKIYRQQSDCRRTLASNKSEANGPPA
jgi:hypothetical protein